MKTGFNRIQKILLLIIAVLAVILAALLVTKGYRLLQEKKQEKEWAVRHQEVQTQLDEVQQQIQELSGDTQALQVFLDEKVNQAIIVEQEEAILEETMPDECKTDEWLAETVVEERIIEETTADTWNAGMTEPTATEIEEVISSAIIIEAPQPEPEEVEEVEEVQQIEEFPVTYAGEAIIIEEPQMPQMQEQEPEYTVAQEVTVSENKKEEAVAVSSNEVEAAVVIPSGISGNAVVDGQIIPYQPVEVELTLEQRRKWKTSYVETLEINQEDKEILNANTYDFSSMKIACLGDSLTEGSNLDDLENYQQYSYPSVLKNLLNAEEVYNLGIGGSSYGRYWDQAFVDRYKEIPQDTDIIVIMGGTNDGFAASEKELGSLAQKASRTFYGDVDELMRGLKADYPSAKIIFVTPLPNILHDYLRTEREYLLPQKVFVNAIKELAAAHEIDVIDLYNSNILDTHDTDVISSFMPDGVHGNQDGYQILAEHIAAEMIQIMEQEALAQSEQAQNSVSANGFIEIELETVSGNEDGNGNAAADQNTSVSGNADADISEWKGRYTPTIVNEIPTYVGENKPSTYVEEEDVGRLRNVQ